MMHGPINIRLFVSFVKTNQLLPYMEISAVRSDIQTKHIKILCAEDVELITVRGCGTYIHR